MKEDGFKSMSELSLEGEVHIDVALLPTCAVPFLEVSVSALLPLRSSVPNVFQLSTISMSLSRDRRTLKSQSSLKTLVGPFPRH